MKASVFITGLLLAVSFALSSVAVRAQDSETLSREDLYRFSTSKVFRTITTTEYSGTPYFNSDWQRGHVMINNRAKSQQLLLRYDAHNNHVEFLENETVYAIPANKLKGFVIYTTDGDIVFKNGYVSDEHDIEKKTLLRVIHEGGFKLLAHHKVLLKDRLRSYGSAIKKKEFVNVDNYYLVDMSGTFHKIKKLREKEVLEHLGENKDELKQYARDHSLSFDNESDLKLLLQYYDSL